MIPRRTTLALPFLLAAGTARAQEAERQDWTDPARDRTLPVLLRWPEEGRGPVPLVLVSHGLGGSREGLAYLGEALATAGFAALHLQHPGTDDSLWRGAADRRLSFAAAISDARRALDRLQDAIFVLDEVQRRPELAGRVDPARLGIAGHSYGAWLVQHMLGERIPGGDRGLTLPDPRLSAGIALSPVPSAGLPPALAFARVKAPMLHVTGTLDDTWVDGTRAAERRIPFDAIAAPGALAVLEGATHASFAGEAGAGARWEEATYHPRVAGLAVTFLRGLWRDDAAARQFLREGAPELLAPGDVLETKGLG
ncbi:acetylhydrolase [Roseomonas sp. E05]|uniref:alpha/beta hydrolase family protein n=1 Tax=Roseomonas sp. E05 TaxID=3046310 RepID=UPI0024B9BB32|nr:acetylhydrolase [Roseomonas sp. E05]MDJ0387613.1 acetylhydrolase [Roseomonas sp. E05]